MPKKSMCIISMVRRLNCLVALILREENDCTTVTVSQLQLSYQQSMRKHCLLFKTKFSQIHPDSKDCDSKNKQYSVDLKVIKLKAITM